MLSPIVLFSCGQFVGEVRYALRLTFTYHCSLTLNELQSILNGSPKISHHSYKPNRRILALSLFFMSAESILQRQCLRRSMTAALLSPVLRLQLGEKS